MSFWETQRQIAQTELYQAAGGLYQRNREAKAAERAQRELNQRYAAALEAAKTSGEMPREFQRKVSEDAFIGSVAVSTAALKELAILSPHHPLLEPAARDKVEWVARVKYNRLGRPGGYDWDDILPSDSEIDRVLANC